MKKKLCFLFFLFIKFTLFAQEDAWVYFTDKPDAEFYLSNPSEMLSEEAINRRERLNILVDELDVPIHFTYVNTIENQPEIEVLAKSKWLNAVHVRGTLSNIQSLSSLSFVHRIEFANKQLNSNNRKNRDEQVHYEKMDLNVTPINYGNASNQIEMLNGQMLHAEGFTGNGMTVAVIDNGFLGVNTGDAFNHLFGNNQILETYNFVNREIDVFSEGTHGTIVLSTMAANLDGEFVGTAPDANYILLVSEANSYESPLEESLWVEAAEYADYLGADVINTSLGYKTFDNANYDYTYEDMDGQTTFISRGAEIAASRGMVCVVSAGNSGNNSWQYIASPADANNVLTVGAVNGVGSYASFSSIGPSADGRIKPNIVAQGAATSVVLATGNLSTANGTSLSSPIIAGLVACLWQSLPSLKPEQIIALIENSASLSQNPTQQMGFGIPNFFEAKTNGLQLVENQNFQNEVKIYPNPTTEILNIQSDFEVVELSIYNVLGQKVKSIFNSNTINCSDLKSGMYFLELKQQIGNQIIKFLKQ